MSDKHNKIYSKISKTHGSNSYHLPGSGYSIFSEDEFNIDLIDQSIRFVEMFYEGLDDIDQYPNDQNSPDNFFVAQIRLKNCNLIDERQFCFPSFLDQKQWLITNPSKVHSLPLKLNYDLPKKRESFIDSDLEFSDSEDIELQDLLDDFDKRKSKKKSLSTIHEKSLESQSRLFSIITDKMNISNISRGVIIESNKKPQTSSALNSSKFLTC